MAKQAIEQTSLIPRSIIRTFDRFQKQLLPGAEKRVIQEFRISRYQVLVSIKCLVSLTVIPLIINYLLKNFLLIPVTEAFWNRQQNEIFLNSYQQNRAFNQIKNFEEKIYFEFLINDLTFKDNTSITQPVSNLPDREGKLSLSEKAKCLKNTSVVSSEQASPCLNALLYPSKCNKALNSPFQENFYQYGITLNNIENSKMESSQTHTLENFSQRENLMLCPKPTLVNLEKKNNDLKKLSVIKTNKALTVDKVSIKNSSFDFLPCSERTSLLSFGDLERENLIKNQQLFNLKKSLMTNQLISSENFIQEEIQEKIIELAIYYNQESIKALTNLFGDFITFGVISFLGIWMKPQIIILKSFITESIYSLSDTTKSFLLILGTDLLVGFHSPRGWEIFLELFLRHFGFPENQDFIDLFVATFPVLLDTVFKYWIFRYLNQISPSTVATYHSMIE